jgi:putative transcriptional regulator
LTLPINYKIDVLEALKKAGYTTYRLRNEKIMGERVIQQLRQQELVSWKTIETICSLLGCQPGDLVEYTHGAE